MKTLLIYYSEDEGIKSLCRKSKSKKIVTCELRELSGSSSLKRKISAITGGHSCVSECVYDLNEFDSVIFASDGRFGGLAPAMISFIKTADLRNKKIYGVVFGDRRSAQRATDTFRTSVSLSGGTAEAVVTVPVKAFKRYDEDVLCYVRHKMTV